MKVPVLKPYLDEREEEAVIEVLRSGWLIMGKNVEELERRVATMVGARYAKACNSCTAALHMAMLALGIGPGDKVLVPAYTFVATANAVEYTGAEVVFVDVDPKTFNIDVNDTMERYLQAREGVKAVVPVHLFGLNAYVKPFFELSDEIKIVEDAACAMGSKGPEGYAGAIGSIGCYSFHPRKSIATGEGGMVVTNDIELAEKMHQFRDFGFTGTNLERHEKGVTVMPEVNLLGYNYRMTDILGAIGVAQIKKWDEIVSKKLALAKIYDKELADVAWLQTPYVPDGYFHTYQSYACMVDPKVDRASVMNQLKEAGVATREGTHNVPLLGYYAKKYGHKRGDFPGADKCDKQCMTIPMYPGLKEDEQTYVIEMIKKVRV